MDDNTDNTLGQPGVGAVSIIPRNSLGELGSWSTIEPGESVVCIETTSSKPANTLVPAFIQFWNIPDVKIATYQGGGVGLSSNGDSVRIFNSNNILLHSVSFGGATANKSFYWLYDNSGNIISNISGTVSSNGISGAYIRTGVTASPGVYNI